MLRHSPAVCRGRDTSYLRPATHHCQLWQRCVPCTERTALQLSLLCAPPASCMQAACPECCHLHETCSLRSHMPLEGAVLQDQDTHWS